MLELFATSVDDGKCRIEIAKPETIASASLQGDAVMEQGARLYVGSAQALSAFSNMLLTTPSVLRINDGHGNFRLPTSALTSLQVSLLGAVDHTAQLTPAEENGSMHGPFMTSLALDWRSAFRELNAVWQQQTFAVVHVLFDFDNKRDIEPRHIITLLQGLVAVMDIKARQAGRTSSYSIIGCDERARSMLATALPRKSKIETSPAASV